MFDINNSRDFYEKLVFDYEELRKDPLSARTAINCAITSYHLAEWIWGDWLKVSNAKHELGFTKIEDFKAWLDKELPEFGAMQSIANGAKHFNRRTSNQTRKVQAAFDADAFDPGAFQTKDMLMIEVIHGGEAGWHEVEDAVENTILFWKGFIEAYGPYKGLPLPPSRVAEFEQ